MRITCPSCAAAYEVPDDRIGAGRRLRCARCKHDWFVTPPPAGAVPEPAVAARRVVPEVAPEPPPPPPRREPPRLSPPVEPPPISAPGPAAEAAPPVTPGPRPEPAPVSGLEGESSRALKLAWAASALAMLGILAALVIWRAPIAEAWPPAERLYVALGLMPD